MSDKGIVVLSFDDGREDLVRNIVPLLKKYNLPATFNITTGYLDGTLQEERKFCSNKPVSINDLLTVIDDPLFEIAAHGDQHINTIEDISKGIVKLKQWGVVNSPCGFASPCHGLDKVSNSELETIMNQLNLKYIRIGTRFSRNLFFKILRRFILLINSTVLFQLIYKRTLNNKKNNMNIYTCVPYNKRISLKMLKSLVLSSEKNCKIVIFLFHSVLRAEDSQYEKIENIDFNVFEDFCSYLMMEREKGKISIIQNGKCVDL